MPADREPAKVEPPSLLDWVVIGISPALIMVMVGSLVFFLVEVLYQGQYSGRLLYTLFFFVFGAVLIARISGARFCPEVNGCHDSWANYLDDAPGPMLAVKKWLYPRLVRFIADVAALQLDNRLSRASLASAFPGEAQQPVTIR